MIFVYWTGRTGHISIFPTHLNVRREENTGIIMPLCAAVAFQERELSFMGKQ
jgi:hypothetical protein